MKLLFIGDIVGKAGRKMVARHLGHIRADHQIDFVVANGENSAHGFGITDKTAKELFASGVDLLTGGNHSWDKKEAIALFESLPILRPHNYPAGVVGKGVYECEVNGTKLAVINLLGHYGMDMVENPFNCAKVEIDRLIGSGFAHIFVDFHAEATSEKNALLKMFEGKISAIAGTHTHIGTDDLLIASGTGYVSDVGLTGIRDEVIGMGSIEPIVRFTTGIKRHFKVPDKGRSIFQAVVFELSDQGLCVDAYKIKAYDDNLPFVSMRQMGGW